MVNISSPRNDFSGAHKPPIRDFITCMQAVRVEHCERVQIIVPTARICVANCRESIFYLGVNLRPLFTGDSLNLQV